MLCENVELNRLYNEIENKINSVDKKLSEEEQAAERFEVTLLTFKVATSSIYPN